MYNVNEISVTRISSPCVPTQALSLMSAPFLTIQLQAYDKFASLWFSIHKQKRHCIIVNINYEIWKEMHIKL
jgi:hypothetical protein